MTAVTYCEMLCSGFHHAVRALPRPDVWMATLGLLGKRVGARDDSNAEAFTTSEPVS